MNLYWIEIKRFLKKYYKIILLSSILFSVFFIGILFITKKDTTIDEDSLDEDNIEIFGGNSKPSYFRFYVEQPDGYTYTNGATVDELFNLDEMYELASERTGIDLFSLKEEIHSQLNESEEVLKPVNVKIDTSSNILTAFFITGNDTDNLKIASFYYNYLFNEGFEILDNNLLYSLEEPQLSEPRIAEEEKLENDSKPIKNISIKEIVKDGAFGFVLGCRLSIGFVVVKELFSKKLNYSFTYNTGNPDYFVLYDSKITTVEFIHQFISLPFKNKKIFVTLNISNNTIKELISGSNDLENQCEKYHSLSDIPVSKEIDEIIIFVLSNDTSRKWYNN